MAQRRASPSTRCVWLLLLWLWPGTGTAADWQPPESDEDLPDMNELRAKADAGQPLAQTRLADCYLAASDFTNAVGWYRRAADQNHIPAQLSLAACLVAGRGVGKDPSEAARLLRASADLLEKSARPKTEVPSTAVSGQPTNHLITAPEPKSTAVSSKPPTNSPPSVPEPKTEGASRVGRVQTLLAAEPQVQAGGSGTPKRSDPR